MESIGSRVKAWFQRAPSQKATPPSAVGAVSDGSQPNISPDQLIDAVGWLTPSSNPFKLELLDCRQFAGSVLAVTTDQAIATRFLELKISRREDLREIQPAAAVSIKCNLSYPHEGAHKDGPISLAEVME